MATNKMHARIQAAYDSLLGKGMRRRPGQELMIEQVANTLALAGSNVDDAKRIALINAPTGTGKTLSYLLPGILMAEELKLPLVVATSSVALQNQLMEKDVPLAAKALGLTPKVALAVGQGRYACPMKIEEALQGNLNRSLIDEPVPERHLSALHDAYQDFSAGRWDARLDKRLGLPASVVSAIKIGAGDCKGNDCPMFGRCSFTEDRLKLKKSDVIVTNHDLLLSSVFRGKVLPAPDESLLVIDEGHHFPYAALNASAVEVSFSQASESLDFLVKALPASAEGKKELGQAVVEMRKLLGNMERLSVAHLDNRPSVRFPWEGLDGEFLELAQAGFAQSTELLSLADKCHESCKESRIEASSRMLEIGDQLNRYFAGATTASRPQYAPQANWLSLNGKTAKGSTSCTVPSRPLLSIWRNAKAVVITSATLKDGGRSFHFFKKFSGIRECTELDIESPFAHEKQAKIIVPRMKSKPDTEAFYTESGQWLSAAIDQTTHGSLVLFSSKAQMASMLGVLPSSVRQDVLVQGDAPMDELLAKHRKSVKNGKRSILAGLLSFGTGLDLPGKECELLVIAKIPFQSPDNPVDATLSSWLEDSNRSPFKELFLPKAAIVLQQWVGRLIRTESDQGAVLVFDRRLVEATYGKVLLDALPKMPIERPSTPEMLSIHSPLPVAAVS